MYTPNEVEVPHWYRSFRDWELLGCIPHNTDCWWYCSAPDEKSGLHVTACFGTQDGDAVCENENYFIRSGSKSHLDRKQTCPYVVFFMGCDDGDMAMRFKSKEEAMLYLEAADNFEDLIEMKEMLYYN